VRVWTADGQQHHTFDVDSTFRVAFSTGGRYLAAGCGNYNRDVPGRVYLFDPAGKKERRPPVPVNEVGVYGLSFKPDGNILAAGGRDGRIHIVNAVTGNVDCRLDGHTDQVNGVCFHPDGRLMASAGRDGTVRLWNVGARGSATLPAVPGSIAFDVAFSPD